MIELSEHSDQLREKIRKFLGKMENCVQRRDRGVLADLRHGFSERAQYRAWPHIAPWCDLEKDRQRKIWLTIGAGFSTHEKTADVGNIGWTLRRIALGTETGSYDEKLSSFDGRFRRLLSCDSATEACLHLVGVIKAAARKNVPINFEELYVDLCYFGEHTKKRWASAYWRSEKGAE